MLRDEYTSRINRVIDYIEKNIDDELSLDTVMCHSNKARNSKLETRNKSK